MSQGDDFDLTRTHRASEPATGAGDVRTWGEFRVIRELGRGGFGRVYHAWDATLARDIALKVVRLPDATEAAAALREGRMLARVRHRNVVTVFGALQIADEVGVWMELIRGRHLSQLVREQGPMGPEEATVVGISVCQALAAVHAAGLIHRDIKANNVMRESGGRIVLMDFGAGRESGPARAGGDFAGTPVYMAPEVLNGGPASATSDLYSVGVLLFFAVTGEYPVFGESVLDLSLAHRRGQRRLLADRRPDLPDGFVRAVERALSPSPDDRPRSAGAMLRDLSGALPGSSSWDGRTAEALPLDLATPRTVTPGAPLTPASAATPPNRARVWAGALALASAAMGLIGLLTSAAFNQSLGRDATFSTDSVFDWWAFGAKSLFGPALLAGVVILAGRLVVSAWQVLRRVLRPFRGVSSGPARWLKAGGRLLGADSAVALSQWLVLLQVVCIAIVALRYRNLILAVLFPLEVAPDLLALLSPDHDAPLTYRAVLTLVIVGTGAAWYGLLSQPEARAVIHRTTITAGAAAMVLAVLMLVVPYRLLYHNEMPRTTFESARCYELGARGTQVLLYCPDRMPRVTIAEEKLLARPGSTVLESIFSQASRLR